MVPPRKRPLGPKTTATTTEETGSTEMTSSVQAMFDALKTSRLPQIGRRSGRLRSSRGRGLWHQNGGCAGQTNPWGMLISLERTSVLRAYKEFLLSQGKPFCGPSAGANCCVSVTIVSLPFIQTCGGRRNHADYPVSVDRRRRKLSRSKDMTIHAHAS